MKLKSPSYLIKLCPKLRIVAFLIITALVFTQCIYDHYPAVSIDETYDIIVDSEINGRASGGGLGLESGSTTTVIAIPNESYVFGGWFVGESLVEGTNTPLAATYSFTVTQNLNLRARFTTAASLDGDIIHWGEDVTTIEFK